MQKIDKILVGTHNKGKFIEISDLLPKKIKKISPVDLGIKSPIENGKTFEDNSEIKAEFFCKNSNLVTLSDDSGLEVDALNGEPGILSSRFAEDLGGFQNAMKEILEKIKKINKGSKAQFISSLTIQWPNGKKITEKGIIKGSLTDMRGKNGFGYDPIFIPRGKRLTFGEMAPHKKYSIDHRSNAFKKIKKFF